MAEEATIPLETTAAETSPIRGELFSAEHLEAFAMRLGEEHRSARTGRRGVALLRRVDRNGIALRAAYRAIARMVRADRSITPAAEWLADNFHVVDEQLREIRNHLPPAYYRDLPKLLDGPFAGYPRVYAAMCGYVAHTDSRLDAELLSRYVRAYLRGTELTTGELWAVAITLRVVLIENLRRLSDRVVGGREARQKADRVADALLGLRTQDGAAPEVRPADWESFADSPFFAAFAVQLFQRLQDQAPAQTGPLEWLDAELARIGISSQEIIRQEHQDQAALNVSVRNIITSMRLVLELDWKEFFEDVSPVEAALRASPLYAELDFASRDAYRHALEELARGSGLGETEIAGRAVRAAEEPGPGTTGEPGFVLLGAGRPAFERELGYRPGYREGAARIIRAHGLWLYPGAILAVTALFAGYGLESLSGSGLGWAALALLGLLGSAPLSEGAVALVNRVLVTFLPPRVLPKLDFSKGIPPAYRTLVAVPAFLRDPEGIRDLLQRLEVHYLANPDGDIRFALLTDWCDAESESLPEDEGLLEAAREGLAELNERYGAMPDGGPRFLLLHRRRAWNERERKWMGWERKRGKLEELNRLLRGARDTTYLVPEGGEEAIPRDVRFVITLDSDTHLPKGAAGSLAGCLAHPLNRPRFDARLGRVTGGYGILQPRVIPTLPGERERTLFHWVTAGPCGIDPYAAAVSDVYQDLLGEGSFSGKGIYDVDAFSDALRGRVPENSLLSHDLFEGSFARSGLLSDVEVLEDFPAHYEAYAARQHRWARGDWQLLPWILGLRGNGLPFLGRWKMLDNLRRSLVPPCAFLSLALGWLLAPHRPGAWTALVLVALCLPYLVPASEAAAPPRAGIAYTRYLRDTGELLLQALAHYLFNVILLAHQAWLLTDAMVRSLWRMAITRRRLLEWVTAAQAASLRGKGLMGAYRNLFAGAVLPVALATGLAVAGRQGTLLSAIPWIALWVASPALALLAGTPRRPRADEALSARERRALRAAALKTWRFFREFVRAEEHFLPPDNFQEDPKPVVAHRTSPTNMGLCLLSVATARDMGWIGLEETADRLRSTLDAMGRLERYRGHFYNWYGTREMRPLEPRYISTVDSGNLAGHLLALSRACREYMEEAEILPPSLDEGLADLIGLVEESARALSPDLRVQAFGKRHMLDALDALKGVLLPVPADAGEWSARVREWEALADTVVDVARTLALEQSESGTAELQARAELMRASLAGLARDIQALFPWAASGLTLEALCDLPIPATHRLLHGRLTLAELEQGCLAAAAEVRQVPSLASGTGQAAPLARGQAAAFAAALVGAAGTAGDLLDRFARLAADSERMALAMDFRFLVDHRRKLFAIGFRVREETLDPSFYDLLASEARLTSFLAVAKGEVPPSHWFRLGRTLTPVGSGAALISWSGSMFEYLMPQLVMRSPPGSLIEAACRSAVRRQIEYGRELGVPWGVSEAAYNIRDLEMTYQYSSFGVPGLGLKRGLSQDRVIAPYATGLAALVAPKAAAANLERLRSEGAEGRYGFYEAIDYTEARLPEGARATIVRAYFAHHQGMMLVALGDVLLDGRMQERFHSVPIVRAVEPLLQERLPKGVTLSSPNAEEAESPVRVGTSLEPVLHRFTTPHEPVPRTHLLSNGNYSVLMTAAGSGFSRWRNFAVTRWREDAVLDAHGQYFYLRDGENGALWSAGYQPMGAEPGAYEAVFAEDKAEIERRDDSLITRLEVVISPEDDVEVRRLTLENMGTRDREIEVTSYCEIVLAPHEADVAHPAFSNLFVQTEFHPALSALLATRRPRSATEKPVWAAHVCGVEGRAAGALQYETDRARFLGRGRTVREPVSVIDGKPLSNTVGAVLDPVFSLRRRVMVPAGGQARLVFATLACGSREQAQALADKYREPATFERVATLAWTQAQIQLRHLGIGPDEARLYQRLANRLFFPDPALRPSPDLLALNQKGQDGLWPYGISGDLPIVFAAFDESGDRNLPRDLLKAHAYWEMKRLDVDLVLVNENPSESYLQPQQNELEGLMRMRRGGEGTRGGVFLLRRDRIPAEDRLLIQASARAVLSARRGSLADQVMRMRRVPVPIGPPGRRSEAAEEPMAPPPRPYLDFFNGLGGFAPDGKEYQIILGEGQWTPAPWVNVIANPHFGFIATEAGSGYTWCGNSRERKLTPWSDDPVSDAPGEALYVRDRESGEVWTPTALPIRVERRPYVVIHGQGYTRYLHSSHGIRMELTQWAAARDPVKISRLALENVSSKPRTLDVTAYAEWVLAPARGTPTQHIVTRRDPATGAITARNRWIAEFADAIAFADLQGKQTSFTCDRSEFLGRNGSRARPLALHRNESLLNRCGAGLDPCAALQAPIELPPGGKAEIVFTLGQADSPEAASAMVRKYRECDFPASLREVRDHWDELLGRIQVKTPDRSLDLLLNRWLPYQVISCRLWARTAFYQAGGAFGFRDQLQDAMALCATAPELAREQILRASGRQFREGDVQHWWHPPSGRGVRTHFSDDRVWLPYAVLHYLEATGDASILEAEAPWIEGPDVPEGREDSYFQPRHSEDTSDVYEHCARALERSLAVGPHGLPLIGSGDWNDGMNRVGQEGKGESGWLAWFLIPNLKGFAALAEARGDARGKAWLAHAERLRAAMESAGWDGDWYRRGYFDDGTPLGSSQSQECRIDSIAQTWAVLSGAADPARARQAMFSVEEYLIKRADGLILLFSPPFDSSPQDPGYIKGYLPGVRENGGQYTHAAVWVVSAYAALGEGDKAAELLSLLNPVNHASTRAGVYRYKVEPYAAAADVYAVPPHTGRGGWTWYTGSAGWLYRAGLEWILGLRVKGSRLSLAPCPPRDWRRYELRYRRGEAIWDISVSNPDGDGRRIVACEIDGVRMEPPFDSIPLSEESGAHIVKIILGQGKDSSSTSTSTTLS